MDPISTTATVPWEQLGTWGTVLGLFAYLLFMDIRSGRFFDLFKAKEPTDNDSVLKKMAGQMDHLKVHFNDDITRILTEIQVTLSRGQDLQLEMHRANAAKLDKILGNQDEAFEYGVPCRDTSAKRRRKRT